jgi:phage baseplate assembly protein W
VIDFRAISYQGITLPTSYREGEGGEFLELRGTGFTDVADVLINGYRSPAFIVESTTRIFAEVPSQVRGDIVTDLRVLLLAAASGQESGVVLSVGGGQGYVSGPGRLMQTVIKVLLTTPGTNIFSPSLGGGLTRITGTPFNTSSGVEARVRQAIANTENQLLAIHAAAASRIPDSERLRSIQVLSVDADIDSSSLRVRIAVTAQNGSRVTTGVAL